MADTWSNGPWAMDHGGRGHGPLAMSVANGPWPWLRPWPMAGTWAMAVAMAMGHGRYLSKPYPFVVPKTPFGGTGVCEKNDAWASVRQLGPPYPRFQCCGLGIEWRVFPRAKKMTFFVNRLGAHHDNIEIEGAGVGVRGLSHKLPCVIFFRKHRSQLSFVFQQKHPCQFGVRESAYGGWSAG